MLDVAWWLIRSNGAQTGSRNSGRTSCIRRARRRSVLGIFDNRFDKQTSRHVQCRPTSISRIKAVRGYQRRCHQRKVCAEHVCTECSRITRGATRCFFLARQYVLSLRVRRRNAQRRRREDEFFQITQLLFGALQSLMSGIFKLNTKQCEATSARRAKSVICKVKTQRNEWMRARVPRL